MNQPLFTIITTTHKRPDLLMRATKSVLDQSVSHWKMIIVNDSPEHDYSAFEQKYLNYDSRIRYIENTKNIGKNASVNHALEILRQEMFEGYIIFLDDDDWLSEHALQHIEKIISEEHCMWLVTNRANISGASFTIQKKVQKIYNYFFDYLLGHKLSGDATHTIHSSIGLSAHFSKKIKNGEEWFYYLQLQPYFTYHPINTTISKGYSTDGLNTEMQNTYKKNTYILFTECANLKMFIYLVLRTLFACLKY